METSFGALLRQLPSDTEVPGLLEDITRTGLGSGLEFEEIKLQPEVAQQFYIELPINIKVIGGYHDGDIRKRRIKSSANSYAA